MNRETDIQSQLDAELDRGEGIVWQDREKPRLTFQMILPLLFVVLWLTIVSFSMFSSSPKNHPPVTFAPFGVIMVLVVASLFFRSGLGRHSYYLITDQRALIITLGRVKKVLTYYPNKLQSLERRERSDGWGDLVFDRVGGAQWGGSFSRGSPYVREVGFLNIPDVKNVENLLRTLAQKQASTPPR